MEATLPATLVDRIEGSFGDAGRAWVARFPETLDEIIERWEITVHEAFRGLSYHYVTPVTLADGARAVLKLGFPGETSVTETVALELYNGDGAVRLLAADAAVRAVLLERLEPGREIHERVDDVTATEVAGHLMRRLWRPLPARHPFPDLQRWTQGIDRVRAMVQGGTATFPKGLLAKAEAIRADLFASSPEAVLLHGDLHHHNILSAEREPWLAIDPHGLAGDPAFDVAAWLKNPIGFMRWPDRKAVLQRRTAQLAETAGLDRQRVQQWGFVFSVLNACWSVEDNSPDVEELIVFAEAF